MIHTSKLCDATDWFDPAVAEIIDTELEELPRFHRKQWEFAMILLALRRRGMLRSDRAGLSMGGGKERVLYALARHIDRLTVTDLYESNTTWDCAKTNDPVTYLRYHPPLLVDFSKIQAMRMDMRNLEFPDRTFDFCYSTCAVEHIGGYDDFLSHFNEVARVLKDDGIYVMTTEVHCGVETIRDSHNYIFSLNDLGEMIAASNLMPDEHFDAAVGRHSVNFPMPGNARNLAFAPGGMYSARLFDQAPHLHLLRGKHPFTAGVFVLRKREAVPGERGFCVINLEKSQAVLEEGVKAYRDHVESSYVRLNPFSSLPGEESRFFLDHVQFFSGRGSPDPETVFHTDYFWFGSGHRTFEISMEAENDARHRDVVIDLMIHRYRTLSSQKIDCVQNTRLKVPPTGRLTHRLEVSLEDDSCYAVLARLRQGTCLFDRIEVTGSPEIASMERTSAPHLTTATV